MKCFFRETWAMFSNHVRAIVKDEHGLNLILSDSNNVPALPLLYIHICDGKQAEMESYWQNLGGNAVERKPAKFNDRDSSKDLPS